jgi:hypothetical protein
MNSVNEILARLYDKKWGKERMIARGKRERRTFLI